MSKEKGSTNFAQSNTTGGWDVAIEDAQAMIKESQERIKRLKRAIETFTALRDKGEPFPSEKRAKP